MNNVLTLRYAQPDEINNWDFYLLKNKEDAGFLQSKAYAKTKGRFGWNIRYIVYESNTEKTYGYFLERRVPLLGLLWYMPSGSISLMDISAILQANQAFIAQNRLNVFVIKVEPKILDTPYAQQLLNQLKLQKAKPIQANTSTIMLDIKNKRPESLLTYLGTKARRDIRASLRQAVRVEEAAANEQTYDTMYELMKSVNRGKGSRFIRPYEYYREFWHNFSQQKQGTFFFAYEDDRPVAAAFIVHFGSISTYKDGGSTPDAITGNFYSAAVQWKALQQAVDRTSTSYDLCGVPPKSELSNPSHPYYGVGRFKLKFSKQTTEYCGCYEQIIILNKWSTWRKLERLIYKLYWLKNHNIYY